MSIRCDVILRWTATPPQLTALGAALWRWCARTRGSAGICQYLDSQPLADLIAGKLPAPGPTHPSARRPGVLFRLRGEVSRDRRAAVESLRRELPADGIEDILVEEKSWDLTD